MPGTKPPSVKKCALRFVLLLSFNTILIGSVISQVKIHPAQKDTLKTAKSNIKLQNDSSDVRNHLLWKEDHTTQQLKKSNLYKREEADLNKNGHPLSEKNDTPSSTMNHVSSGRKMTATFPDKTMQPDKADSTTHTIKGELKQQKENHPGNHLMWKRDTAVNRN